MKRRPARRIAAIFLTAMGASLRAMGVGTHEFVTLLRAKVLLASEVMFLPIPRGKFPMDFADT
jgi:hypothetical protein